MSRLKRNSRLRTLKPYIESLEIRLTPSTGEIQGTIWNDLNGNGIRDPGEPGQSGVTVFLDLNQDGLLDPGEPSTLSGADGSYAFTGLIPGNTYVVAEALPPGLQQTSPASPPGRSVTVPGAPITLNFNSLTSPSDQTIPAYHQAGYTIDTSVSQPTKFDIWGTSDSGHYAGQTAASSHWAPATISVTQDNGQPFNLFSIDLAPWFQSVFTPTVSFTGNKTDGTTVQQSFTIGGQLQFQTVTFTGFTNLLSVQWGFTGTNDYHQFTNIVIAGAGVPIATGIDFGMTGSPPAPSVSVGNGLTLEAPGSTVTFPVGLSNFNPYPVTVYYSTADGTAVAGRDYVATAGALTIPANTTQATVSVPVVDDSVGGPDRTFYLNLVGAVNARVTYGQGVGTILDDDVVVAANDSFTISSLNPLTIAAPGVLGNDTPANSTALTAVLVSGPANGTVSLMSSGSFTYTPGPGFSGSDTFTYRAMEGVLQSNVATVTITTNAANQPPVAMNDNYTVNENQTLVVAAHSTMSLYLNSQPGDFIGQGQTATFTPATGTFRAQFRSDNSVSIYYTDANPSVNWTLDFAAPNHALLIPGYMAMSRFTHSRVPTNPAWM